MGPGGDYHKSTTTHMYGYVPTGIYTCVDYTYAYTHTYIAVKMHTIFMKIFIAEFAEQAMG